MASNSAAAESSLGDQAAIETLWINGTEILVPDVERSVAFYQRIFGLPLLPGGGDSVALGIGAGPQYLLISPAKGRPIGIANFSLAVTPFEPEELARKLSLAGASDVRIEASGPGGATQVVFLDSRGFAVRLEAAGPPSTASETPGKALVPLTRYSHITFLGERAFYQGVFGLPVQAMQGPAYMLRVGPGPEFIVGMDYVPRELGPTPMPGHICFAMEGYDPNTLTGWLMEAGLKPVEYTDHLQKVDPMTVRTRLRQVDWNGGGRTHPLGSYETYLRDPDNIELQIQDVSYAGGSGVNGQICP